MTAEPMTPYGQALLDFFHGDPSATIVVHRDDGYTDNLPAGIFFREPAAFSPIEQVALDPGHYLGHPQTLALMESEYLYPNLGDRTAPGAWEQEGSKDMLERAHETVVEVLSGHYPNYIDAATDREIRQRFPIRLPRKAMSAESGRW